MVAFIDCTSLNISFNVYGVATVSYVVVADAPGFNTLGASITAGGRIFSGYITSASVSRIPNTTWYETHVTFIAMTTGEA